MLTVALCIFLQHFILTWHKDIRPKGRTMCWDVSDVQNKAAVNLFPCHGMQGNQLWRYNAVSFSAM
jgi:polypeptide N-acetylgalactosaminyltransferase